MKLIVLCVIFSLSGYAQNAKSSQFYSDYVECYYNTSITQPLYIYDSVNGRIIDSIYNSKNNHSWLKLAITESDFGWLKIKNLQRFPEAQEIRNYENYWVKNADILLTVDNDDQDHTVYLYEYASLASNKLHKVEDFQTFNLIEITDLWAKVYVMVENKQVRGWLPYSDQNANPCPTCPK